MHEHKYSVTSTGQTLDGYFKENVYLSLASMVNVNHEKLHKWFSGPQRSLSKGLSKTQAAQYQQRFRSIGLVTKIQLTPNASLFDFSTSQASQNSQTDLTNEKNETFLEINRLKFIPKVLSPLFKTKLLDKQSKEILSVSSMEIFYNIKFLFLISLVSSLIIQNYFTSWLAQQNFPAITFISIFTFIALILSILLLIPRKKVFKIDNFNEQHNLDIELIQNQFDYKNRSYYCEYNNEIYFFSYDSDLEEYSVRLSNNQVLYKLSKHIDIEEDAKEARKELFDNFLDADSSGSFINFQSLLKTIKHSIKGSTKSNDYDSANTYSIKSYNKKIANIYLTSKLSAIKLLEKEGNNKPVLYTFFIYLLLQTEL